MKLIDFDFKLQITIKKQERCGLKGCRENFQVDPKMPAKIGLGNFLFFSHLVSLIVIVELRRRGSRYFHSSRIYRSTERYCNK